MDEHGDLWTSYSSMSVFQLGKWNGLMAALVNKQTDMVLSALKVADTLH